MSGILSKLHKDVKLIEGNDEVRSQKCLQAVRNVCQQYDCLLVPSMTIQGNQVTGYRFNGDVAVMPIPRQPEPKLKPENPENPEKK